MEAIRPDVEAHTLAIARSRTFTRADFHERSDGSIRVMAPFSHELTATLPTWRGRSAATAEAVAHMVAAAAEGKIPTPTPITRAASRHAAAEMKGRHASKRAQAEALPSARRRPAPRRQAQPYNCPDCGGEVAHPRRVRCDGCIDKDPRQTPQLRKSRAEAISRRRQAEAAWADLAHDLADWEHVRPALAGVGLSAIMADRGVSKSTAWAWKTRRNTPHRSHSQPWPASSTHHTSAVAYQAKRRPNDGQ